MDSAPVQAAVIRGGIHVGHPPHPRGSLFGWRTLSPGRPAMRGRRGLSRRRPVPSEFQVVALQGGKLNSSSHSLPGMAAGVVDVQPAVGISFHSMAANQVNCPSMLQAAKSSYLTVRTVQVEGASLLCDVARGITRPLVPLVDRPAVFHAIHTHTCHQANCLHFLCGGV